MVKPKDETGNIYGRLTVIKEIGRKRGAVLFLCHCECDKYVEVTGGDLRTGRVNSCGCLKSELRIEENTTHGLKNHRLYRIYHNIITRCYNPKATHFKNYGGRGITVCDEWLDKENGFVKFYNWAIESGYSEELSIDRINVNGNYEPNNCRWANNEVQAKNRRTTRKISINNETKTIKEWCEIFEVNYKTAMYRLNHGWEETKAVSTPVNKEVF